MRIANLMSNIAQITILVLVLPLIAAVFPLDKVLDQFIMEIPVFELWADVLSGVAEPGVDTAITVYLACFVEAMVMGFAVHMVNKLAKEALGVRGLMILPTFIGISIGAMLMGLLGVAEGASLIIYAVLLILGISLMLKGIFSKISLFPAVDVLGIIVDGLLAVIMCGYVTALKLLSLGAISIGKFIGVLTMSIIALVVSYVLSKF